MTFAFGLIKFVVYTFMLNVVYRQLSNVLFILLGRPRLWLAVTGCLGFFPVLTTYLMGGDPRLITAVVTTVVIRKQ